MIKVTTSVTHPSKTVPGRNMSSYISTPITEPTHTKVMKVIQNHLETVNHHLKIGDPDTIRVNISIQ
jgi:hypothetical protein